MKILVLGVYYSQNLGDAVICDCVKHTLMKHFPGSEVEIVDMTGREGPVTGPPTPYPILLKHKYGFILRQLLSRIGVNGLECRNYEKRLAGGLTRMEADAARAADVAVFAGGQIFMDPLALFDGFWIRKFEARGVPVLMNAGGCGPSFNKKIQAELRAALASPAVKYLSTRDDAEGIRKKYLPAGKTIFETTDPALAAAEVYGVERAEDGRDTIGLGIMFSRNLPLLAQKRFWKRMIRFLEQKQIKWKAFSNGDTPDETFIQLILKEMGLPASCALPRPETPEELVGMLAGMRGIISMRLHSHIIAASLGFPAAAVVWDEKIPRFYKKLGRAGRCFSIYAKPARVWQGFLHAEQEGTDTEAVRKLADKAETALVSAVREAVKEDVV